MTTLRNCTFYENESGAGVLYCSPLLHFSQNRYDPRARVICSVEHGMACTSKCVYAILVGAHCASTKQHTRRGPTMSY